MEYTEEQIKKASISIGKSSEFKKLDAIFKDAGKIITVADILALTIEVSCMNKELTTILKDNVPVGSDLYESLNDLIKEQQKYTLEQQALKVIERELLGNKLLSILVDSELKKVGEWLVAKWFKLGKFEGSGNAVSLGKLAMYFGSY